MTVFILHPVFLTPPFNLIYLLLQTAMGGRKLLYSTNGGRGGSQNLKVLSKWVKHDEISVVFACGKNNLLSKAQKACVTSRQ